MVDITVAMSTIYGFPQWPNDIAAPQRMSPDGVSCPVAPPSGQD